MLRQNEVADKRYLNLHKSIKSEIEASFPISYVDSVTKTNHIVWAQRIDKLKDMIKAECFKGNVTGVDNEKYLIHFDLFKFIHEYLGEGFNSLSKQTAGYRLGFMELVTTIENFLTFLEEECAWVPCKLNLNDIRNDEWFPPDTNDYVPINISEIYLNPSLIHCARAYYILQTYLETLIKPTSAEGGEYLKNIDKMITEDSCLDIMVDHMREFEKRREVEHLFYSSLTSDKASETGLKTEEEEEVKGLQEDSAELLNTKKDEDSFKEIVQTCPIYTDHGSWHRRISILRRFSAYKESNTHTVDTASDLDSIYNFLMSRLDSYLKSIRNFQNTSASHRKLSFGTAKPKVKGIDQHKTKIEESENSSSSQQHVQKRFPDYIILDINLYMAIVLILNGNQKGMELLIKCKDGYQLVSSALDEGIKIRNKALAKHKDTLRKQATKQHLQRKLNATHNNNQSDYRQHNGGKIDTLVNQEHQQLGINACKKFLREHEAGVDYYQDCQFQSNKKLLLELFKGIFATIQQPAGEFPKYALCLKYILEDEDHKLALELMKYTMEKGVKCLINLRTRIVRIDNLHLIKPQVLRTCFENFHAHLNKQRKHKTQVHREKVKQTVASLPEVSHLESLKKVIQDLSPINQKAMPSVNVDVEDESAARRRRNRKKQIKAQKKQDALVLRKIQEIAIAERAQQSDLEVAGTKPSPAITTTSTNIISTTVEREGKEIHDERKILSAFELLAQRSIEQRHQKPNLVGAIMHIILALRDFDIVLLCKILNINKHDAKLLLVPLIELRHKFVHRCVKINYEELNRIAEELHQLKPLFYLQSYHSRKSELSKKQLAKISLTLNTYLDDCEIRFNAFKYQADSNTAASQNDKNSSLTKIIHLCQQFKDHDFSKRTDEDYLFVAGIVVKIQECIRIYSDQWGVDALRLQELKNLRNQIAHPGPENSLYDSFSIYKWERILEIANSTVPLILERAIELQVEQMRFVGGTDTSKTTSRMNPEAAPFVPKGKHKETIKHHENEAANNESSVQAVKVVQDFDDSDFSIQKAIEESIQTPVSSNAQNADPRMNWYKDDRTESDNLAEFFKLPPVAIESSYFSQLGFFASASEVGEKDGPSTPVSLGSNLIGC